MARIRLGLFLVLLSACSGSSSPNDSGISQDATSMDAPASADAAPPGDATADTGVPAEDAAAADAVAPTDATTTFPDAESGDNGPAPDATEPEDGAMPPADAGFADATPPDTGPPDTGPHDAGVPGPGLTGVLYDENGVSIGGAQVMACTLATCYFGTSAADGRFSFMLTPPVDVALKTHENIMVRPRRAAFLQPINIVNNITVDVGPAYAPLLPMGPNIGPVRNDPQTLSIGDGLELTFNRADLMLQIGEAFGDMAARIIVPAHIPPLPELGSETLIALYAIHPFAANSSSPIAVRAASTVAAGTVVKFRSISELDGRFSAPAMGTADGTHVQTNAGDGITHLTWLVISY